MGLLRLVLALLVVVGHTHCFAQFNSLLPEVAVKVFFMISGFYMAMILQDKYRGAGSYRLFLGNRFLRIYPVYFAVLAVAVGFWAVHGSLGYGWGPLQFFQEAPAGVAAFISFANTTLFGSDAMMFLRLDPHGALQFTHNFWNDAQPLWPYLILPPAWTLALELMFYLLAPLLVRQRTWVLVTLIGASLALRLFIYVGLGWRNDPWTYRFFPCELAFFLSGSLAYRGYLHLRSRAIRKPLLLAPGAALFAGLLTLQLAVHVQPKWMHLLEWSVYAVAFMAVPALFLLSKRSVKDRYVGELSYPIYICHWVIIVAFQPGLQRMGWSAPLQLVTIAIMAIAAAGILNAVIARPIETIRTRQAAKLQPIEVAKQTDPELQPGVGIE